MKCNSVNKVEFLLQITVEMFKLDENNEYQLFVALPQMGMCDFLQNIYRKYFSDMGKYVTISIPFQCPLVKKYRYETHGYPLNMSKFESFMSIVKPGSYRLQIFLTKYEFTVSGILVYCRVTEKS